MSKISRGRRNCRTGTGSSQDYTNLKRVVYV